MTSVAKDRLGCVRRHLLRGRTRRGAAMIEAAIVLFLLLLLTFGLIEFGHYFFIQHTMKGAAWAGVRVAITPNTNATDAMARVQAAVSGLMGSAGISNTEYTTAIQGTTALGQAVPFYAAPPGATITVAIECTWGTVGVRPMELISGTKRMHAEAVMLKE